MSKSLHFSVCLGRWGTTKLWLQFWQWTHPRAQRTLQIKQPFPRGAKTPPQSLSSHYQQMRSGKRMKPVHFIPGLKGLQFLLALIVYHLKETLFNSTLEKNSNLPSSLPSWTIYNRKEIDESWIMLDKHKNNKVKYFRKGTWKTRKTRTDRLNNKKSK